MDQNTIKHKFVKFIPKIIKDGILYISVPYATATHKCACGCGEIVVTPIRPTDWNLIWNGITVSISPSIGNWSLPCKSHYFIEDNKIIWAKKWSFSKIKLNRKKDKIKKKKYFKKLKE